LYGSLAESKPKIRKIRRIVKTENIKELNSSIPLRDQVLNNTDLKEDLKQPKIEEKINPTKIYSITSTYFETLAIKKPKVINLTKINSESLNYLSSTDKDINPDYFDDIKNLKNMIMHNESTIEILNIKISELTKNNTFLNELNDKLKDQLSK
jgi:hypothetical protein